MLKIYLTRYTYGKDYTEGKMDVEINGIKVECYCDTLEPAVRDRKVKGKTAIPEGTYELQWSPSAHFHRMMPYLKNVPNFTGVMIHPGNTNRDTQGCILVGEKWGPGYVRNSRRMSDALNKLIETEVKLNGKPTITIKNGNKINASKSH